MGPDEYHAKVDNNVYTNIVAALAIYMADFRWLTCYILHVTHVTRVTRADFSTCAGDCLEVPASWVEEASRLKLEYDEERDFHPQVDTDHSDHAHPHGNTIVQYTGYTVGTVVKQADTVLAGYPLMYPMAASTRAQVTMSTCELVT